MPMRQTQPPTQLPSQPTLSQTQWTQQLPNQAQEPQNIPSLEESHTTFVPTIKFIPKGARGPWAKLLAETLDRATTVVGCQLLAILPKCVLPADKQERGKGGKTLTATIKERMHRWRRGEIHDLWIKAVKIGSRRTGKKKQPRKPSPDTQQATNKRRTTDLAREGQYTKATEALTSAGIATTTIAYEAMKAKHPQGPQDIQTVQHSPDTPALGSQVTLYARPSVPFIQGLPQVLQASAPNTSRSRCSRTKRREPSQPPPNSSTGCSMVPSLLWSLHTSVEPGFMLPTRNVGVSG